MIAKTNNTLIVLQLRNKKVHITIKKNFFFFLHKSKVFVSADWHQLFAVSFAVIG